MAVHTEIPGRHLASSTLAVFSHRRLERHGTADHRLLGEQIRDQLDAAADDPCRWP